MKSGTGKTKFVTASGWPLAPPSFRCLVGSAPLRDTRKVDAPESPAPTGTFCTESKTQWAGASETPEVGERPVKEDLRAIGGASGRAQVEGDKGSATRSELRMAALYKRDGGGGAVLQ